MGDHLPPLVLLVLIVACTPTSGRPTELGLPTVGDLPTVDFFAEVTDVSDGDSFRAAAEDDEIEVRLLGINAPELGECYGPEAAQWLRGIIGGGLVGLATAPEPDQFGRVLADAVRDRIHVNRLALSSGHALAVSNEGSFVEGFVEDEQEARVAGSGLWADNICGATGPKPALEIEAVEYDPPGPHSIESVTIFNAGEEEIDLSGFVLRDESSVNRLVLPAVSIGAHERLTFLIGVCPTAHSVLDLCSEGPVFNNDGDTAMLMDPFGRVVALARY